LPHTGLEPCPSTWSAVSCATPNTKELRCCRTDSDSYTIKSTIDDHRTDQRSVRKIHPPEVLLFDPSRTVTMGLAISRSQIYYE